MNVTVASEIVDKAELLNPTVRSSPARHLFWTAVGLIAVSGTLLALQLFYLRVQALETGERLAESLSHVVEEQTARTLQSIDQRLQLAAGSLSRREPEVERSATATRLLLREHLKEMPFVRAMWVLDVQGRIKYNSDEGNIGLDLADRDYFQIYQSQPTTTLFLGKPVRSRTTGNWLVSAARPLMSANGRFAGVVVVALEPSYFERIWAKAGLNPGDSIALWRRDGLLMMRSPVDDAAMGKDFKHLALFRDALPEGAIGTFQSTSAIDGQLRRFSYRTVSSHSDLVVVVGQSVAVLLKPWRDFALLALAVWGVAATCIAVLCIFLARAWRHRIRAEADATEMAQRLTLATEAAAIGIWDWDVRNDRWFASPICFTMLGQEPKEGVRIREQWVDRIHPEDRAAVLATMQATLDGKATSYEYEARVQHADGSYRWIRATGRLLTRDAGGKASRILGVRIDVTARKQAEIALRESEERFRSIWKSSVDGMRLCDTSGHIVSVNSAYCAMVGKTSEELVGQSLTAVYADTDSARIRQSFIDNAHAQTIEKHVEKELALWTGDKRWFALSNTQFNAADGGRFVLSIFRDISERKQTELALADSEKRFRAIVERSPDAMCVYRNARILYVNPAAVKMVGAQSAEQLIGRSILELVHPDSRKLVTGRLKDIADGDTHDSLTELRFRTLAGNAIEVEARGTSIVYAGLPAIHVSLRDITAAKQAEAALRMSEVALAEAQRVAQLGGWRRDAETGKVEWSDELYRIFGLDLSLPTPDYAENLQLYTSESAAKLDAAMQLALLTGEGYKLDLERSCADGQRRWIGARGEVLRDVEGKIVGLRGTAQDITSRKQADAARASLEAQVRESQKMEAIGTLAGGIAHDFNNILATILGNTELARQDLEHNSPVLESLDEIKKAGSHARDLVRQILSFSRRAPSERKLLALGPSVHETVRLLRATLPARLLLKAQLGDGLPLVLADATQMQQVVINLVNNAMQAIGTGAGRIDVRLSTISGNIDLVDAPPSLSLMRTNHPGPILKLEVRDDGPGMDAATRARVFEPFFTTKPVDEGTGLGLAVVHGIVLAHDGTIVVDSEPGKGAAFAIYLPTVESAATTLKSGTKIESTKPLLDVNGGQHILYIDDDEALIFLVKRMLEKRGYHLHGYTNQREALSALRAKPSQFDLVVTDYNMPGMSGLDVARAVRDVRADLPVVVASGFIDETLRAQASGAGVRELIFKANVIEDLCDAFVRLARTASEINRVG